MAMGNPSLVLLHLFLTTTMTLSDNNGKHSIAVSVNPNYSNAKKPKLSPWPRIQPLPTKETTDYYDLTTATTTSNSNKNNKVVKGVMNYCASHVTAVQTRRDLGGTDGTLEGAEWVHEIVKVRNARLAKEVVKLDTHGFQLLHSPIKVKKKEDTKEEDKLSVMDLFLDSDQVVDLYYPQCELLVKQLTGASTVCAFDHNIRSSGRAGSQLQQQSKEDEKKKSNGNSQAVIQQPAGVVHNDYTHVSAPRRLEQLANAPKANDVLKARLQDQSVVDPKLVQEALSGKRRYAFINVWRNIRIEPVQQFPLACVNSQSQSTKELLTFQIIYADRIGENYFVRYSTNHEWNYFPDMTNEEALLIKQWDSHGTLAQQLQQQAQNEKDKTADAATDSANKVSTFALHSAFMDPTSSPDAPPRESCEVRCIVIW